MNMLLVAHAMNYSSQIASDVQCYSKENHLRMSHHWLHKNPFANHPMFLHYNIRQKYLELPSGVESTSGTSEPL